MVIRRIMASQNENSTHLTRRAFGAVLAAPALLAQEPAPRQGTVPEAAPFDASLSFSRHDVAPKVEPFPMTQVRLLDGPFHEAQEWNRGYMKRLPADRLLHNFRLNAGLPSSAEPLGGWEEPKRRTARPLHRPLSLRLRADVRVHRQTRTSKPKATTWSPSWRSARRNSAADT